MNTVLNIIPTWPEVEAVAKRRFADHHKERGGPATCDDFIGAFRTAWENGFSCHYCKAPLKPRTPPPEKPIDTASVDHYISIFMGGKNEASNLRICCYGCNIFKGTARGDLFEQVVRIVLKEPGGAQLWRELKISAYQGALARKLERQRSLEVKFKPPAGTSPMALTKPCQKCPAEEGYKIPHQVHTGGQLVCLNGHHVTWLPDATKK